MIKTGKKDWQWIIIAAFLFINIIELFVLDTDEYLDSRLMHI